MPDERKTPWGSKEMGDFLNKLGIKASGDAMSTVMALDYASRDKQRGKMQAEAYDLAIMRVSPGNPDGADPAVVRKLTNAILKEYERQDGVFQPEAYADAGPAPDDASVNFKDMEEFTRKVPKVRAMLASFLAEGKADKAKTTANTFADNAVKSGFWTKGKNELIKPMLQSAHQDAQKMKAAPPIPDGVTRGQNGVELPNIIALSAGFKRTEKEIKEAFEAQDGEEMHMVIDEATEEAAFIKREKNLDVKISQKIITDYFFTAAQQKEMRSWDDALDSQYTEDWGDEGQKQADSETDGDMDNSFYDYAKLSQSDVKKVDMKSVASVYGFGADEAGALEELAKDVVKKGADNPGVQKSAKDLMAASKKKKNAPKVKSGRHFVFALRDAVMKAMHKKKVTKPMKASDIPE